MENIAARASGYTLSANANNSLVHEDLLRIITLAFGLSQNESDHLIKAAFDKLTIESISDTYTTKLALVKFVLRGSVYSASTRIFNQKQSNLPYLEEGNYFLPQRLIMTPLTIRAVYILFNLAGFKEKEIAYILNIEPMQVIERLGRARKLLKKS